MVYEKDNEKDENASPLFSSLNILNSRTIIPLNPLDFCYISN